MLKDIVDTFITHLKVVKNASPHTLRNYTIDLTSFNEYLCKKDDPSLCLKTIDRKIIRGYIAWLHANGLRKRSVARKLSAIRSFFKYAHLNQIVSANPTEELESPKLDKTIPPFLTYDQVTHLFNQPDTETLLGFRDRVMMELLYSSGLRVSELTMLDREDFFPHELAIKLKGKGRKERIVPITKNAADWIIRYLHHPERHLAIDGHAAEADKKAVFLNKHGLRLTPRSVDRRFCEYLSASGLAGKITPHTIRHTIATHWLENGMNLKTIQMILGHSALATTTIYTQVSPKLKKKVYDNTHPRAKKQQTKKPSFHKDSSFDDTP